MGRGITGPCERPENVAEDDTCQALDRLWDAYRRATPDPEVSPNFMPDLWAKIGNYSSASFAKALSRLAVRLLPVAAAVTLAVGAYNWNRSLHVDGESPGTGYVDSLVADVLQEEQPEW